MGLFANLVLFCALVWTGTLIVRFVRKKRHHLTLLLVRDRIENVYLITRHPMTGEAPDVGESLAAFCEFVDYGKMEEAVAEWTALLKESGNRFWDNDEIRPSFRMEIICIFFQDGEFVNEDFAEYSQRVGDEVRADRAIRHETLKRMNGDWYRFAHHGQNVVTWAK